VTVKSKSAYHHGDLRNALVRAAAELAEEGGPDAVTIRAAARAVGVTPTATYRHFTNRSQLLMAARDTCLATLAERFIARLEEVPEDLPRRERALTRFLASGREYIEFALDEPGLYRTCFCAEPEIEEEDDGLMPQDTAPYLLLSGLLDDMVAAGAIDPAHRPHAEGVAWSTVHGLVTLMLDGPMRRMDAEDRAAVVEATLANVARGLSAPAR
jgi:AcrR family transcriptional regulator